MARRRDVVLEAHVGELANRAGREAVPAGLLTGELLLLDNRDVPSGVGQPVRARRPGRTRADDDDVVLVTVLVPPLPACRPRASCGRTRPSGGCPARLGRPGRLRRRNRRRRLGCVPRTGRLLGGLRRSRRSLRRTTGSRARLVGTGRCTPRRGPFPGVFGFRGPVLGRRRVVRDHPADRRRGAPPGPTRRTPGVLVADVPPCTSPW